MYSNTTGIAYGCDQFQCNDRVRNELLCYSSIAPTRVSQGAPFAELLKGLGTISDIEGEWDIDLHRVTKGLVSTAPGLPYLCFSYMHLLLYFAIDPFLSSVSESHEEAKAHRNRWPKQLVKENHGIQAACASHDEMHVSTRSYPWATGSICNRLNSATFGVLDTKTRLSAIYWQFSQSIPAVSADVMWFLQTQTMPMIVSI